MPKTLQEYEKGMPKTLGIWEWGCPKRCDTGSRKFSLYFHENLSQNLLSLLDFYVNYKDSIVLPDILSKCSSESYKQC